MEIGEYENLALNQEKHWWCVARRKIVLTMWKKYFLEPIDDYNICDIGCGMGGTLEHLQAITSSNAMLYGSDMEDIAVSYCKNMGLKVEKGVLPDALPFKEKKFKSLFCLDVLEHVENDLAAARKIHSIMETDGIAIITVPAMKCMWSYNDVYVHHKRRYTKKQLIRLLEKAGFKIVKCSYYNFWLFLPILLVRSLKKALNIETNDLNANVTHTGLINKIFYYIFLSEKAVLARMNFPFGVSLIAVVKRID